MRVLLFRTESCAILSYPVMLFLAAVAGYAALVWRVRRRDLDHGRLAAALIASLVAGWIGSRLTMTILRDGIESLSIRCLMPREQEGMSFTGFMAFALPVFLGFLRRGKRPFLEYLDAVAPSAFIALALAKAGCLLAGCCAGEVCPEGWGLRYPYGSLPHTRHVSEGRVGLPDALMKVTEDGTVLPLMHIDLLRAVRDAPPAELVSQASRHGLTYAELVRAAEAERSLPVWPVPVWYIVASGALWMVTETLSRLATRTGWTSAASLVGYGCMRLALDPFLAKASATFAGITLTQAAAGLAVAAGAIIGILAALKRTQPSSGR